MEKNLVELFNDVIWVSKALFSRGKVTGSSANISFLYKDEVYISRSGACFGNMNIEDFAKTDFNGRIINDVIPSKELPLHIALYEKEKANINAVIHTHSFYSTMWSMLKHKDITDIIPCYTPYLQMKLGKVGLIEYYKPGSDKLFTSFREHMYFSDGFILKNHGPIIGAENILNAFYIIEELEESARIAWELVGSRIPTLQDID